MRKKKRYQVQYLIFFLVSGNDKNTRQRQDHVLIFTAGTKRDRGLTACIR